MKKKQIVYISGNLRGENFLKIWFKFLDVENSYDDNWTVINPLKKCKIEWGFFRRIIVCVFYLFKASDIVMLPDWKESNRSKLEHWIAKKLNLIIKYL